MISSGHINHDGQEICFQAVISENEVDDVIVDVSTVRDVKEVFEYEDVILYAIRHYVNSPIIIHWD